jgi:hypothetical protein
VRAIVVAVWMAVATASAAPWETVRRTVIDPLNSELHRHLPSFLRARDLEALLGLYATDTGTGLTWDGARPVHPGREEETLRWEGARGPEPIRERYRRLLDLLPALARAELRIDRVGWRASDADGYPAAARSSCAARADGAAASSSSRWRSAWRSGTASGRSRARR